jgi:hypothetical protein
MTNDCDAKTSTLKQRYENQWEVFVKFFVPFAKKKFLPEQISGGGHSIKA